MSGPYRDGPAGPPAPLGEVLWRRRVGAAATWLLGLLVAEFAVRIVYGPAHWHVWFAVDFSLLRYGDGYAEVIHAEGQWMRFTSRAEGE